MIPFSVWFGQTVSSMPPCLYFRTGRFPGCWVSSSLAFSALCALLCAINKLLGWLLQRASIGGDSQLARESVIRHSPKTRAISHKVTTEDRSYSSIDCLGSSFGFSGPAEVQRCCFCLHHYPIGCRPVHPVRSLFFVRLGVVCLALGGLGFMSGTDYILDFFLAAALFV